VLADKSVDLIVGRCRSHFFYGRACELWMPWDGSRRSVARAYPRVTCPTGQPLRPEPPGRSPQDRWSRCRQPPSRFATATALPTRRLRSGLPGSDARQPEPARLATDSLEPPVPTHLVTSPSVSSLEGCRTAHLARPGPIFPDFLPRIHCNRSSPSSVGGVMGAGLATVCAISHPGRDRQKPDRCAGKRQAHTSCRSAFPCIPSVSPSAARSMTGLR